MSTIFITGAGTEVGKTLAACALIEQWRGEGKTVAAFKPVLSGYDAEAPQDSDAGRLLTALGEPVTPQNIQRIAPLRFDAPLSPPDAARREGAELHLADLVDRCRQRIAAAEGLLIIEGAGGVMSPIAQDGLNLDLMAALEAPIVLAASNYLGAISHTLTALAAVKARGLTVAAVVVQSLSEGGPELADTVAALRLYAPDATIVAGSGWQAALAEAVASS